MRSTRARAALGLTALVVGAAMLLPQWRLLAATLPEIRSVWFAYAAWVLGMSCGPGLVVGAAWLSGLGPGRTRPPYWRLGVAALLFVVGAYLVWFELRVAAYKFGPTEFHRDLWKEAAEALSPLGSGLLVAGAWLLERASSRGVGSKS